MERGKINMEKLAHENTHHAGHALLETALIIPVVLGLVLAAVDVNNFLRSYQAIQEGTRTALRCSYVVDGACIDVSAAPVLARYEAFIGSPETETSVDSYRFNFREKFIESPRLRATGFTARVFDNVRFQYQYFAHSGIRRWYPATGYIPQSDVPVQNGYPRVTVVSPETAYFNWQSSQGWNPIAPVSSSGSALYPSNSSWTAIAEFDFPYDQPRFDYDPNLCVQSTRFNVHGAAHAPGSASCTSSGIVRNGNGVGELSANPPRNTIPVNERDKAFNDFHLQGVLHVTGSSAKQNPGAAGAVVGKVLIRLREERRRNNGSGVENRVVDLGGRQYEFSSSSTGASLYPRGAVGDISAPEGAEELRIHAGKIAVRPGSTYIVEARLDGEVSDAVTWTPGNVRMYLPQVQTVTVPEQSFNCRDPLTPSQALRPRTCRSNQGLRATSVTIHTSQPAANTQVLALQDSATAAIDFAAELAQQVLTLGMDPITPQELALDWQHQAQSVTSPVNTRSCPANFGTAGLADTQVLANNSLALAACPAPGPASIGLPDGAALASGYSHGIGNLPIAVAASELPTWPQVSCSDRNMPQQLTPALVAQYGTWRLNGVAQSGRIAQRFGQEQDPDHLIQTPQFSCPEFSVGLGGLRPNAQDQSSLPASAFVLNPHFGPYCEDELVGTVRDHAITELGYESDAFLVVEQNYAFSSKLGDGQHSFPSACTDIREVVLGLNDPQSLGEFLASELPPEACQAPGSHCNYSFLGVDPSDAPPFEILSATARQMGLSEMQAMNPSAQIDCTGPNCFDLAVASIADGSDMIEAVATGTIKSKLLLGKEIPVSYRETARWEGFFAGP
jgi:hypothetical protein